MPKTGTTAIQKFLTQNSTILAQKGIYYPIAGRLYSEDGVLTYDINNAITSINGGLLYDIELFKKHLDIFANNDCSTMVLSEENLFYFLNDNHFCFDTEQLWRLLSNYNVKINYLF